MSGEEGLVEFLLARIAEDQGMASAPAMLAPVVRATDDVPSADPLAELFWLHRLFGDWDDDDSTCGCGATPPEDAREEAFGIERWHDSHLAAAVRDFPHPSTKATS